MAKTHERNQLLFLERLIKYFHDVDALPQPIRLRASLDGKDEFPAPHQKIVSYELSHKRRFLVADGMGAGKTGSAVATFEILRDQGKAHRCLVVCPAKVVSVWRTVLQSGAEGYFDKTSPPEVVFLSGRPETWDEAKRADYVVVTLEALRVNTGQRIELIKSIAPDFLVVDEAHNAKSLSGSDSRTILSLSALPSLVLGYQLELTGTPAPNTLEDLAMRLQFLYRNGEAADAALGLDLDDTRRLARQLSRGNPLVVRNLLVRRFIRRPVDNFLAVGTALERRDRHLEPNPIELARYNAIVADPFTRASEKIQALRGMLILSETKYQAVREEVHNALKDPRHGPSAAKVVVAEMSFARGITRDQKNERSQINAGGGQYLAARLAGDLEGVAQVWVLDGMNSGERENILREFRRSPTPGILVTLSSVAGEGIDLTCAAHLIQISPSYTVAAEEQLVRRLYRRGQKLDVCHTVLSFRETIEEGIALYAKRKSAVIEGILNGRPLNRFEREVLESSTRQIRAGGVVAYESLSPRQQALWILSRIQGKGRSEIERFLELDDGRYAKDFAEGYPANELISASGNTARLVTAIVRAVSASALDRPIVLADIACGCRTMERMLEDDASFRVLSTDINRAALIAGSKLRQTPCQTSKLEVSAMDELPHETASCDIAVLSLALHMTRHNRIEEGIGEERIRTLRELKRILKPKGLAVLAFQNSLFPDETAFSTFREAVTTYFGFEAIGDYTGAATARNDGETFRAWILTVRNTETSAPPLRSGGWKALRFPGRLAKNTFRRRAHTSTTDTEKSGAYQDQFVISNVNLTYLPSKNIEETIAEERNAVQRLVAKVQDLIARFGEIEDIPEHLLLSVSAGNLMGAEQSERDEYFHLLFERYGAVERIPIEKIPAENNLIVIREKSRAKGSYLCLARKSDGKTRGFGRRYTEAFFWGSPA